jgi:hypothetical protein
MILWVGEWAHLNDSLHQAQQILSMFPHVSVIRNYVS